MKKVDMIVDLQYGSTGKGLIAGYLAQKNGYDVVVNANMPNAGHTFINAEGRTWMHKVIPNGIVSPKLEYVMMGPGSVFDVDRMMLEIIESDDLLRNVQILIHENAVVLRDHHTRSEARLVGSIGSTGQGSMEATVDKMARDPKSCVIARDYLPTVGLSHLLCTQGQWNDVLRSANRVLAEGAQGFSLGINQKFYPYCTSRECTPTRLMSEMAIPHNMLKKVIGTCRTYPIRVGGNSGDCYDDQVEIEWESLGIKPEKTTVTNRDRRIFTFSRQQIFDAIRACAPDEIFLNFCNYPNWNTEAVRSAIRDAMTDIHGEHTGTLYMGVGPKSSDVREIRV